MSSFAGPWSSDLDAFKKSLESIPSQYKSAFTKASQTTLEKVTSPSALHIWECSSDIDSLLQLTSVIASLCNLGVRTHKGANDNDGAMLILAEEKRGWSSFSRICELVGYLTCVSGKKHLEGTVAVFGKIVVARGWDNSVSEGQVEALQKCIKRVNTAAERTLSMGGFGKEVDGKKKTRRVVWHQGPAVWFLLQWIDNTTPELRSALCGITVTDALDLATSIKPSVPGRANSLAHLERLEKYARKMDIPVVFLDTGSQDVSYEYLGTYMYFFAYYINTFLPVSLLRPHLHKGMDELVTFSFRLRAASENRYGAEVVKVVQKQLDAGKAKQWAKTCVDKDSYEKSKCRAAGKDEAIHHAVQLADSPFAQLSPRVGAPAFARLAVGPASASANEYYTAAPVSIGFSKVQMRPSCPSTFHILIPQHTQDLEKVTNRVQGLMMAVLERVRQEKGNPVLGDAEKGVWEAVVKACEWAIDGSEGKMPGEMAKKVKFVRQKLREGTWGFALDPPPAAVGAGTTTTAATAAAAMPEPNRTYGFGMGTQQTMGSHAATLPGVGQHMPQQMPQQAAAYPGQVPAMMVGQLPQQGVYPSAQGQGMSLGHGPSTVGGGYPQSMGGPWR